MSTSIEKRVEALEASRQQAVRWVWRREGETVEQAKQRESIPPDAPVLVFSWLEANL